MSKSTRLLLLTNLQVEPCNITWLGRKDSNLRMPESKSGALTSLATPQLTQCANSNKG
jgi:hypothetical protein